ncbi:MAG TPA: metallopeptidase family protein [Candidatus Limnocylindrales bacterium]|nr:metallopeptidase family protein [Candidatus Limnocylindrales bacterium]
MNDGVGEVGDGSGEDYFERMIEQALDELPPRFRAQIANVAIVIDDVATPELLAATNAPGLFGVYQGIPRTAWGADHAAIANKITIFRRPIEAWYPAGPARAQAVRDTLFHEIAHHFGISDERLDELSRARRRRSQPRPPRPVP